MMFRDNLFDYWKRMSALYKDPCHLKAYFKIFVLLYTSSVTFLVIPVMKFFEPFIFVLPIAAFIIGVEFARGPFGSFLRSTLEFIFGAYFGCFIGGLILWMTNEYEVGIVISMFFVILVSSFIRVRWSALNIPISASNLMVNLVIINGSSSGYVPERPLWQTCALAVSFICPVLITVYVILFPSLASHRLRAKVIHVLDNLFLLLDAYANVFYNRVIRAHHLSPDAVATLFGDFDSLAVDEETVKTVGNKVKEAMGEADKLIGGANIEGALGISRYFGWKPVNASALVNCLHYLWRSLPVFALSDGSDNTIEEEVGVDMKIIGGPIIPLSVVPEVQALHLTCKATLKALRDNVVDTGDLNGLCETELVTSLDYFDLKCYHSMQNVVKQQSPLICSSYDKNLLNTSDDIMPAFMSRIKDYLFLFILREFSTQLLKLLRSRQKNVSGGLCWRIKNAWHSWISTPAVGLVEFRWARDIRLRAEQFPLRFALSTDHSFSSKSDYDVLNDDNDWIDVDKNNTRFQTHLGTWDGPPGWRRRMWSLSHFFSSDAAKYAIKHSVTTSISLSLMYAFDSHWDIGHKVFSWQTISIIVLMQPTMGASFLKSILRIIGTIIGAFLGFLCVIISMSNSAPFIVNNYVLAAVMAPLYALSSHIMLTTSYPYAGLIGGLTGCIVIISSISESGTSDYSNIDPFLTAWSRTLGVFLGIVITLVISRCIWPYLAHTQLRIGVAEVLNTISRLYSSICASCISECPRAYDGRVRSLRKTLRSQLSYLRALLPLAVMEPRVKGPVPMETMKNVVRLLESMAWSLYFLRITCMQDLPEISYIFERLKVESTNPAYDVGRNDRYAMWRRTRSQRLNFIVANSSVLYICVLSLSEKLPLPRTMIDIKSLQRHLIMNTALERQEALRDNSGVTVVYFLTFVLMHSHFTDALQSMSEQLKILFGERSIVTEAYEFIEASGGGDVPPLDTPVIVNHNTANTKKLIERSHVTYESYV